MNKIAVSLVFASFCVNATPIVLGEYGPTYEIKEKDMIKEMRSRALHIDKSEIRKKVLMDIKRLANKQADIGGCVVSSSNTMKNIVKIQNTYLSYSGEPMFEKGQERIVYSPAKRTLCVIDGSNKQLGKKSIDALLNTGKCDKILVANRDFREYLHMYPEQKIYPYNRLLVNAMHIECMPSRSSIYKEDITIESIAVGSLK